MKYHNVSGALICLYILGGRDFAQIWELAIYKPLVPARPGGRAADVHHVLRADGRLLEPLLDDHRSLPPCVGEGLQQAGDLLASQADEADGGGVGHVRYVGRAPGLGRQLFD